jgi:hypothetical protein
MSRRAGSLRRIPGPSGDGEVLGPLQHDPEVLDAAEVIADELAELFPMLAVNGDVHLGHGALLP